MRGILDYISGNYQRDEKDKKLSVEAEKLVNECFQDLPLEPLMDYHAHVFGIGTGGTGNFINSSYTSPWRFLNYLKYKAFANAAGVKNEEEFDKEVVQRFIFLISKFPYPQKIALLALDHYYKEDGTRRKDKTNMYISNEYVYQLSQQFPDLFIPCVSIHPYRKDALDELEKWADRGIKMVKWIPNTMNIDPSHHKCMAFYNKMRKLDMVLISHTGMEDTFPESYLQPYGNPLLFRNALDTGVKVIMAHCASLGLNKDLDSSSLKMEQNFKLFLRLMDEDQYKNNLFGDISGITQINRSPEVLGTILQRTDLHHRLLNGSDYPLPAINMLISTAFLRQLNYISVEEEQILNEVYHFNPLLFDFVLKRTVHHPKSGNKFSPLIFIKHKALNVDLVRKREEESIFA